MSNEDLVGAAVDPIEAKTVDFYGDDIPVVRLSDDRLYVPIIPIANALGLSVEAQRRRVQRDEVMAEDVRNVRFALSAGIRTLLVIPLEQLPGFLFGLDSSRVKPELREKVNRYRRECFRVLWQAFAGEPAPLPALPTPTTLVQLPDDALTPAERDLKQAATIYQLAIARVELERRQAENEAGLNELAARHQAMADYVRGFIQETRAQLGEHDQRLVQLERGLVTADPISEAQATQISQAVKLVADLVEQRTSKRAFGMVYDTLYRRFEITTYKLLPHKDFEAAMQWLRGWYEQEQARQQEGASA